MSLSTLHLPSPLAMARHALPHFLESAAAPAGVFYGMLWLLGLKGALIATLACAVLAVARRWVMRQRVPGILLLATAVLSARTVASLVTGSAFVYFIQPTVTMFLMAVAFLVSVPAGKPLAERLARDFCPLDAELLARPRVRQFFQRISLLWTLVLGANAAITLWLLLTASLRTFVLGRTLISWLATAAAIGVSVWMFRRALHGEGIALRFSRRLTSMPERVCVVTDPPRARAAAALYGLPAPRANPVLAHAFVPEPTSLRR